MRYYPMPVGLSTYFEGDISLKDQNTFGFFYVEVEVEADKNMNYPFLQTIIKSSNGAYVTVSPVGS
jgi:DNA polymerase type B, organellar and viral